jgi:hypothetical protein
MLDFSAFLLHATHVVFTWTAPVEAPVIEIPAPPAIVVEQDVPAPAPQIIVAAPEPAPVVVETPAPVIVAEAPAEEPVVVAEEPAPVTEEPVTEYAQEIPRDEWICEAVVWDMHVTHNYSGEDYRCVGEEDTLATAAALDYGLTWDAFLASGGDPTQWGPDPYATS